LPPVTFCVGLRVADGVVGLADTQIVKGGEASSKAKLSLHDADGDPFFVMTSGLRSIRDKAVLRLLEELDDGGLPRPRLHHVATAFGEQLRAARREDGPSLEDSGLRFNLHAIIGGQLADDEEPMLFLVYPEGNWVVATAEAPSFIIGRTSYGKPILDRLVTDTTPLVQAAVLAYLAFDATRASVVDVDFPIDMVAMADRRMRHRRYEREALADLHARWHAQLRDALDAMPTAWADGLLAAPDGTR
jgi:putative proteasome-type protease